jgi:hypothetical protein
VDGGPHRTFKVPLLGIRGFQIKEVRLYDETIQKVIAGHPEVRAELPVISYAVQKAIVTPTAIELSYSNSYVFVDHNSVNRSGAPLRVPVRGVTDTSARVTTFFFGTAPQANVIWRRP